jgi:serine/threonine protein kinase
MPLQTILNYKVLSVLGEGGMGVVYLAEHSTLERKVAIKILHTQYAQNPSIKERFINEAKILSKLNHPNIVTLYDFADQDNKLYLIMEYVEGMPMDDIIRKAISPLPESQIIPLFKQILGAFEYAHTQGIIHRDIKPSNIIIKDNLAPKILDFGIAKIIQTEHRLTKTGTKMGSVIYMSPEQVMGQDVDKRTDIYSLGITLFETLTNFNPYDSPTESEYSIQNRIITQPLPPLRQYNPNVSEKLEFTVNKATAKNPAQRFSDCREFIEALEGSGYAYNSSQKTVYNEPPQNYSPAFNSATSGYSPGIKPKKKNPLIYILSGIFFLIVIAVGIIIYLALNSNENVKDDKSKQEALQKKEDSLKKAEEKLNNKITPPPVSTENSTSMTSEPEQRVREFITSLGNQNFNNAFNIYKGYNGSYQVFSSSKGFGCISYTNIYSTETRSNSGSEAEVYASYRADDPCNKSGNYNIIFQMYKSGSDWYIRKYYVVK